MGRAALWCLVTLVATVALGATVATPALADVPVPGGYRIDRQVDLAPGVAHLRLVNDSGPVVAHVARIDPRADVDLRAILSNERVGLPAPGLERTTEMCARVGCLMAVNADFFGTETGEPVGGVIAGGQLLRSPNALHHQLSIGDQGLSAATVSWEGQLMPSDLRPLALDGVNVSREADQLVLYTPAQGPTTAANPFGSELVVRVVEPAPPVRLGQTALVELVEHRPSAGATAIPADGAVLSGHGVAAAVLDDLWGRVQSGEAGRRALLRIEAAGNPVESVGGTPILVRDGRRWVVDDGSDFVNGRHPRTMVGWAAGGQVILVTVDGRQPGYSAGMSLIEAADFMIGLGSSDALNLDGGGSTTFVVAGGVANQPSDRLVRRGRENAVVHQAKPGQGVVGRVERPVAVALAVVPRTPVPERRDPLATTSPSLPLAPGIQLAAGADPGSDPSRGTPALVGPSSNRRPADAGLVALATLANVGVAEGARRSRNSYRRRRPAAA